MPVITLELAGGVRARLTGRTEGDMGHGGAYVGAVTPEVDARRRAVLDRPWTWLRQVHSDHVVGVDEPGGCAGATGDAAVTDRPGCALAVLTADCAPVVLAAGNGVLGVAHAGWRGLVAGVVERTVEAMTALGAGEVQAAVGPCIGAECYEFGGEDLDRVEARLGPDVRAVTAEGRPALDLGAAVRAALARAGVGRVQEWGPCTACSPAYFSWRRGGDRQRQAAVVWR